MSTLTGRQISDTYKQILKLNVSANSGATSTLTYLQTGDATNIAMKVATNAIQVTGKLDVDGSVRNAGDVSIGGTVTIGGANLQATNAKVCASAFYGDGSNLTGVPTSGDVSVSTLLTNCEVPLTWAFPTTDILPTQTFPPTLELTPVRLEPSP